jgi:hypothetical protein
MAILYQWQVSTNEGVTFSDIPSDTASVSGTKTSQIIFNNLTIKENYYQYRVRISDTDLTIPPVVSRPAILRTAPEVSFSAHPLAQITKTGSATFSGTATTDYGQIVSYQWQRKPNGQSSFQDLNDVTGSVSGSKSSTLNLSNLSSATNNGDRYRLAVTAKCCGTSDITVFSNEAPLLVIQSSQSLYFTLQPQNSSIDLSNNVLFNFTFNIDDIGVSDPIPTPVIQWQEVGANGTINDIKIPSTTTSTRSSTTINYSSSITIPSTTIGKNYRVVITYGSSSIISSVVSVLSGVSPCLNCGGSGTGDPHYWLNQNVLGRVGFDDNKNDGNGAREILMMYIRDKQTNTEYLLTVKNTGTFGQSAPFNVGRTSVSVYKDRQLVDGPINDKSYDMMGVIKATPSVGRFGFVWSILESNNLNKLKNIDIEMGGAWYWMLKSYIQYKKNNSAFTSLGWPWIGWIWADAIGIGLAPFNLKRSDFEINTNDTLNGDPKDVSRLSSIINANTVDDMTINSGLWSDLSNALQGKPLNGNIVNNTKPIISFVNQPIDTISINGSASFVASVSSDQQLQWQVSKNNGLSWTDIVGANNSVLTINVSRADDNNLYRAVNKFGTLIYSNTAKLTVPKTLAVGLAPANVSAIDLKADFIAVASGVRPIIYKWEKSDDKGLNYNTVPGGTENRLELTDLKIEDDGDYYRVNIVDGAGDSYTSGPAILTVRPELTITQQPVNATADEEEKASFVTSATCSNGGIKYRWQLSEDQGKTFINLTQLDSGNRILNISGLKISDNGKQYRAQIITDLGSNVYYTNLASLSVPGSITVNSFPTDQIAISKQASFTVNATSTQPPLTYRWQKSPPNSQPKIFTDIVDATGATYVATELKITDDNTYYRVILEDQRGPIVSPEVYVDTTPQITILEQPSGYIPYNYNLKLYTRASTTTGDIKYSWQKSLPNENAFIPMSEQDSGELSISVVPADSGSQYRATISVEGARDVYTNFVKIDVPPSITVNSKLQKSAKINFPNKDIVLSIDASTVVPPLLYQWQRSIPVKTSINYTYTKNDIFYDYTELLLGMEGDNGSKNIVDDSKNSFGPQIYVNNALNTNGANISLSTDVKKIGDSSIRIGERAAIRITDPTGLLEFGDKDFTIECWCFPTAYSEMAIISRRLGDRYPNYQNEGWSLSMNKFKAKIDDSWNAEWISDSLDNIELNSWNHIALTRKNSTYRFFRNGTLIASFVNGGILDETSGSINIGIGKADNHENQFNGYLDTLRITKGLARYIDDFNPESVIDNNYDAYYNSNTFSNIPNATGSVLELSNLVYDNNYERYRVILTDSVSSVIVEE